MTLLEHVQGAGSWSKSLQDRQSEFLTVLALVLLSIILRRHRSPQSKPVQAPHAHTGA